MGDFQPYAWRRGYLGLMRSGLKTVQLTLEGKLPESRRENTMSETVSGTTIYQRIGGEAAISAAVDRFYERVLADPTLSHFQRGQHSAAEGASVCLPLAGIGRP